MSLRGREGAPPASSSSSAGGPGAYPGPTGRRAHRQQTQGVDQTQRACHPCSSGGHPPSWGQSPPCRGARVSADSTGRGDTRVVGRGRDGSRMRGFTYDDTAVAVAGSLTRSRSLGAVGALERSPQDLPIGPASRGGVRRGETPVLHKPPRGQRDPGRLASFGGRTPTCPSGQPASSPPLPRGRSGAPQRQASPGSRKRPARSFGRPQRGQTARGWTPPQQWCLCRHTPHSRGGLLCGPPEPQPGTPGQDPQRSRGERTHHPHPANRPPLAR